MRKRDIIGIAVYNVLHRKRFTIRVFIYLIILTTLISSWLVLSNSLNHVHDSYLYSAASSNYLPFGFDVSQDGELVCEENPESLEAYQKLNELDSTSEPTAVSIVDVPKLLNKETWIFANIKRITAVVNGKEYQGINDYSYYYERNYDRNELESVYTVPFNIQIKDSDIFCSKNDLMEFEHLTNGAPLMIAGSENIGDGQLIITDYMLEHFGMDISCSEIIGKKVSFLCEGEAFMKDFEIVGVMDSRVFLTNGKRGDPQIIIGGTPQNRATFPIAYSTQHLPINGYDKTIKVLEEADKLGGYGFSIELHIIAGFYETTAKLQIVLKRIVALFGITISAALFLMLYQLIYSYISNNKSYYGMLIANGILKKDLIAISLAESLSILIAACIAASQFSALLLKFISGILFTMVGTELSIEFSEKLLLILATFVVIFLILIILQTVMLIKSLRSTRELLCENQI